MERGIFDNLNDLFYNKTSWNEYSESDKKKFSPFMINRWISMSMDYIGIINYLQQFTIGLLGNKEVYNLYKDILPKTKFYSKYIKADKTKEDEANSNLIKFLCEKFFWSEDECAENLKLLTNSDIISTLKDYGLSDADIKKQFKLK